MKTQFYPTLIQNLGMDYDNRIFVKREDLIPVSFGGNKARKALLFFDQIDKEKADCVVTYGSSSSNHVRIVCNLAAMRGIKSVIISPLEASEETYNSKLREMFGAEVITVLVKDVHDTIEKTLLDLKKKGMKPFFIPGGGHGNTGTRAYVNAFLEIREFEKKEGINFDYIFFASGTGTTHAGLVAGKLLLKDDISNIIGISIARPNPRGRKVVIDSIWEYLEAVNNREEILMDFMTDNAAELLLDRGRAESLIEEHTVFDDSYIGEGYGKENSLEIIRKIMIEYGIPLDSTYTGKAWYGMKEYLLKNGIKDKNILFIHTGGTPLFFDTLNKL